MADVLLARTFLFGLALAALAVPGVSDAQQKPSAPHDSAAALKAEADKAMLDLQYQRALSLYERAFAESKDPALYYNRCRALDALARFPEALEMIEAFDRQAPADLKARVPDLSAFIAQIRGKVALLTVRVDVPGATVRLGESVLGAAPLEKKQVNAGKSELVVTADGYELSRQPVELGAAKETTFEVKLVPKDKRGTLVVRSPVAGATVVVDGKPAGSVPAELRLAPGRHTVTLDHADYYETTSQVDLGVAERKILEVPLEAVPEPYETWWFWTILGGSAAAGAAVGIGVALSTERDPDEGKNFSPGQIPVGSEQAARAGIRLEPHGLGARFVLPIW